MDVPFWLSQSYRISDPGGSIIIHIFGAFMPRWSHLNPFGTRAFSSSPATSLTPHQTLCVYFRTAGAYFGLAANQMITPKKMNKEGWDSQNTNGYIADLFSLLGTLFLFLYWPSFKYATCLPVTPSDPP